MSCFLFHRLHKQQYSDRLENIDKATVTVALIPESVGILLQFMAGLLARSVSKKPSRFV